ncbi:ABSCISIC ACID-INSENSITIVE 5-like protein 5 [Zea mays]|uniref:ABSCISIC ACID-INSENSITIVE 5-like protein 5 n=1 Tax=Zea mays TaxID=4577 RepID=A0A1D6PZD7_MAIZE|nr:ABSCISIC ACID-INSENSITIVE 5-like protein 5 [Zea mays]
METRLLCCFFFNIDAFFHDIGLTGVVGLCLLVHCWIFCAFRKWRCCCISKAHCQ